MTEQQLTAWLQQQTNTLDGIIAKAAREFHQDALETRSADQFGFDLAECQYESWYLRDGKDLCYDRPNTPFVYALWYHARRVNTFLTHFVKTLYAAKDLPTLEIFDLGAGAGAVQWAVGLVYHQMKASGMPFPKLRMVNVDTSPFMLQYSKNYLWKHFLAAYPRCAEFSGDIVYDINSWSNQQNIPITNPWITASYLFDISDNSSNGEYKKAVLKSFQEIIANYKPAKFLLLTAVAKEPLVDAVAGEFASREYLVQKVKDQNLLLKGLLPQVNRLRLELYQTYLSFLTNYREQSIRRAAGWDDVSFIGSIITRRQTEMFDQKVSVEGLQLHSTTIRRRREVQLNEEQNRAARNVDQPTVIIGPAGCGKSIVITERIRNIVEAARYNPTLRILLTTFNVALLDQLKDWLLDILDSQHIEHLRKGSDGFKIYFRGASLLRENIHILHFDMLPKHLGRVPYWRYCDDLEHRSILRNIIDGVKVANGITDNRYDNVLDPVFLLEEYQRVIYGLQVGISHSKDEYLAVQRKGRGTALDRGRRILVWQCLVKYANYIYSKKVPSFVLRRQLFLSALEAGQVTTKYDYVVVDEFQDCTRADFQIFFHLLNNPNNLVISGDLAQAVHLGRSANVDTLREAIRGGRTMNDISWNYLDGSYRLPFRVCEAIKKVSEYINLSFRGNHGARVLTPYKGAPPGARPIVVVGHSEKDLAQKIREIIRQYAPFGLEQKCVLEKDWLLAYKLDVDTDSVLRLKGLEKQLVVWSTRAGIDNQKEKFEFVYTILSRTSAVLVIALFEGEDGKHSTQEMYKDAIGLLNQERLIFWDKESKEKFPFYCQTVQVVEVAED